MGGVENVRGIFFQHAHSVLTGLDVVGDENLAAVMVEGTEDVMDIAVFDHAGKVVLAKQVKTRAQAYTWGKAELLGILRAWLKLDLAASARFEFVTDGRLGPTGETVKAALEDAAAGELGPAAWLLQLPVSDPAVVAMAKCSIRQDELGVEPVLAEAEREVRSLLAVAPGDAEMRARGSVDRLFFEISKRSGSAVVTERMLRKAEILDLIDGTAAVSPGDRWDAPLRVEYLTAVSGLPDEGLVVSTVSELDRGRLQQPTGDDVSPVSVLLSGSKYQTLSGPSGTGKSTTTRLLRKAGVGDARPVVITHAEAYVAGRLDSLVAAGLSALVGRDLPTLAGRQLLADDSVTVVIDGVSEVPASVRQALADELKPLSATGVGARVVVAGRDVAALGAIFSNTVTPTRYKVTTFDAAQCHEVTHRVLDGTGLDVETELAKADHALGDMVSNPMMLTMALQLLAGGADFQDRAELYARVIEQMAARTGTTGISVVTIVLGITYAGLLDDERRYANEYEWQRRVTDACELLKAVGVEADRATVLEAAEACGLVTRIGHTQVRVPTHDSFADYLAGVALGEKLADLPTPLTTADEQRVLFAGARNGVTAATATALAADLPFAVVQHARYDTRTVGDDSPAEVAALLALLAPGTTTHGVRVWKNGTRIIATLVPDPPTGWIDETEGRELMHTHPTSIVETPNGPLAIAARLWSLYVIAELRNTGRVIPRPIPGDINEAIEAVVQHTADTATAFNDILNRTFSRTAATAIREQVGPLGLRAWIYADPNPIAGPNNYSLLYERTDELDIRAATAEEVTAIERNWVDMLGGSGGMTGTDALLREHPHNAAAKQIRNAAIKAANTGWL